LRSLERMNAFLSAGCLACSMASLDRSDIAGTVILHAIEGQKKVIGSD